MMQPNQPSYFKAKTHKVCQQIKCRLCDKQTNKHHFVADNSV